MHLQQIRQSLLELAAKYPPDMAAFQARDAKRIAYNIHLVSSRMGTSCRIADLGGGVGLFSVGCAAVGMQSIVVDDFNDQINKKLGDSIFHIHRSLGVEVVSRDVIREGIDFPAESLDAVTTFDSMEHWHHSPKSLFHAVMKALKPGGLFVLGVPNCVNLRKRLAVPFGVGSWSQMEDWYEQPLFRAHVREPSVKDLRYIARDMGLNQIEIVGRNWLGYLSRYGWVRALTPLIDVPLRVFPTLCSDIYVLGRKPGKS